jgi:hypothetical protein
LIEDFSNTANTIALFFGRRHCEQSVSRPLNCNRKLMNKLLMFEAIFSFCLLVYGGFCFYFLL